ncbi:2-oxoglutarate dehydrogenase E2 component (dihydrolipoamide succinyltransferase) [Balneicella halophila]|uniref:Dihydrolipoamide acetyltransferase component of pyruvate dehydrogenase complex n=1 Tax=Balneicella halophila TaxID=1537566 RepID=A0A7L4UPW1_BALHA|nr:dihydrolipoamide acetyltransferase family protein [Balneicella halophila]PVX50846.1 2-oxoglutarate dehydrogenase E2 component (dihydrolipoamide succinyltransferase) [Balneicella halophila]
MSTFNIVAPKLGESVQEVTITKWFMKVGDMVQEDDLLMEVGSDKVDSEIPSPVEGKIIEIKHEEGDVVPVGDVIAVISLDGEGEVVESKKDAVDKTAEAKENGPADGEENEETAVANDDEQADDTPKSDDKRFYSPLVKNIAKKEGISADELASIEGNGANGRVQKADILKYLENRKSDRGATEQKEAPKEDAKKEVKPEPKASTSASGDDTIIEMNRMRKIIADKMSESKHTAPHVTSMVEADVTNVVKWRNAHKKAFQEREGRKLTYMPIIIEAVVKALRDFPRVNAHLNGYTITEKKDINMGIAVSTNSGDLMVPVIKNADHMNLVGITAELDRLAEGARTGDINVDDLQGGTFTISNFGSFRNVMGTPIINIPEVAILAVGTIEKKPAVIETPEGDLIVPRSKMFLSLSYDHRVIDGMLGGSFLRKVADYLEEFDTNRTL